MKKVKGFLVALIALLIMGCLAVITVSAATTINTGSNAVSLQPIDDAVLDSMMMGYTAVMLPFLAITLFVSVLFFMSYWKIFQKADEPGWASIVPFYCNYVLYKIAFGNGWLFLLSFVPVVNVVMVILLPFMLAKAFGKDIGWGFGLLFLNCIFYPMLAFGSSRYTGNRYLSY